MVSRLRNPLSPHFDGKRRVLSGGSIEVADSGSDHDAEVYVDEQGSLNSENPIPLDGAGRAQSWVSAPAHYRLKLRDKNGSGVAYADPYLAMPASLRGRYSETHTYNVNDITKAVDNKFYVSLIDGNRGNNPVLSPSVWTEFSLIRLWNDQETYTRYALVQYNHVIYSSSISGNTSMPGEDFNWTSIYDAFEPLVKSGRFGLLDYKTSSGTKVIYKEVQGVGFKPTSLRFSAGMRVQQSGGRHTVLGVSLGWPNQAPSSAPFSSALNIGYTVQDGVTVRQQGADANAWYFNEHNYARVHRINEDGFTLRIYVGLWAELPEPIRQDLWIIWNARNDGHGVVAA